MLIGAVETSKKITWSLTRDTSLRIISKALAEIKFIDELRILDQNEQSIMSVDDEEEDGDNASSNFAVGEVKHSIVQVKLSRGQVFEADWEALKAQSYAPHARMDIIRHKIEQGPLQWNDVIDDIAHLDDVSDRFMLLCELAEAAVTIQHTDSARFFKLVHDSMKEVTVPDSWSADPSPISHPLAPLASLYGAGNRHEDYIAFIKEMPQPDRDILIAYAIIVWLWNDVDTRKLLAYADEIEHHILKAEALCDIAYWQASDHSDIAQKTLTYAEQLFDEARDERELYSYQREMTAGQIIKVKLKLGNEELVDTYSMNEEEELVSNLLHLELDVIDKALEKGHVQKAKKLADQIIDDKQQAIAYGWIAYEFIKRAKTDRALHLITQELSPYSRLRPIAELMWRLSQASGSLFYGNNNAGTFVALAIKTMKEDLKDTINDELRASYIRVLIYAGKRIVTDSKNELTTSNPTLRSKQLTAEFTKALTAQNRRFLPKLALLLTPDDKKSILKSCANREIRHMAEAAMLACEL